MAPSDHQRKRMVAVSAEDKLSQETMKKDWLNPVAMSHLKAAAEKRADTVVLNGIRFNLEYGVYFKSKLGNDSGESVKVKRADGGFAPFGYVSLRRLAGFEFDVEES
jgi:hypothetical protein